MTILLVLSEQAAPQPQFARVLSLAPVLFLRSVTAGVVRAWR